MSLLPYNKVCEVEDFDHPHLASVIREVCRYKLPHFGPAFPKGAEHRKDWEVAMAVRALDDFGVLRPDATVLGVAVGMEDTLFYLTRRVGQVFATDRYYGPGRWGPVAPGLMLVEPQDAAPFDFDVNRLVVQHMDGRWLRYPPETFDGIFSSGSIEHFGQLEDAAYAAYEMGRVLKPGGILALSTEFRLSGPRGGMGWPGETLLFSAEHLQRYIVEASGLEPVDDLVTSVSQATLSQPSDLDRVNIERSRERPADAGPEFTIWQFPHIVLVKGDYVFGSVHLTLRKTDRYPAVPNEWAKPPPGTLATISAYNRSVAAGAGAIGEGGEPAEAPAIGEGGEPAEGPVPLAAEAPAVLVEHAQPPAEQLGSYELGIQSQLSRAVAAQDEIDRLLAGTDAARDDVDDRLLDLGRVRARLEQRLSAPDMDRGAAFQGAPPSAARRVTLPQGVSFDVVLDASLSDVVSQMLASPHGLDHDHGLKLMLDLLEPEDRMLDLGAHVGSFCLAAAAAGCRVIAVEASPSNAALLRSSIWRNGFHQLRVINAAVAAAPGTVQFHPDGPHGHVAWGDAEDTFPVPAVTVDELVSESGWETVSFVKMDIEGSETAALAGMERVLGGPAAPPVLFESNGHTLSKAGSSPRELVSGFEALGYTVYLVDPGRLTRISSGDMQPQTVVDCLAVKRRPRGLDDWMVVPSMTLDDCVERVVSECRHPNPDCRVWVARELASSPGPVRSHPDVERALEGLRGDPRAEVRAAAAWSSAVESSEAAAQRTGADAQ